MKAIKKIIIGVLIIVPIGFIATVSAAFMKSDITILIGCTQECVPPVHQIVEWYLLNYRGTPEDLDILDKNTGLSFVIKYEKLLRFFIEKGAPVNKIDNFGSYPLHSAVVLNLPGSIKILLEHGADRNLKDKDGRTPLELGKLMKVTPPIEAMKMLE